MKRKKIVQDIEEACHMLQTAAKAVKRDELFDAAGKIQSVFSNTTLILFDIGTLYAKTGSTITKEKLQPANSDAPMPPCKPPKMIKARCRICCCREMHANGRRRQYEKLKKEFEG